MKKLILLLSAFALFGCGEKKEAVSEDPSSTTLVAPNDKPKSAFKQEAESEEAEGAQIRSQTTQESKGLPSIPAAVTAEFIMDMWSKPHDESHFIDELKYYKPGTWKLIRNIGPRQGELVERLENSFTFKWVERRFVVQKVHNETGHQFSVMTYDYDTEFYRWWGLMPDGSLNESSGKRYWRDLVDWKSVRNPDDSTQFRLRETVRSEGAYKAIFEIRQGGDLVAYAKDEAMWIGQLEPNEE